MNKVFVVMGWSDDDGTSAHTVRVFASRDQAFVYAQKLQDEFFSDIAIVERTVEDRRVEDRRKDKGNITFIRSYADTRNNR